MRSAAQRAAQLKAAKASALARRRKGLKGQSVYRNANDQSGRGTARKLTKADYEQFGSPSRTTRPGLRKGTSGTSLSDTAMRQGRVKASQKQNNALDKPVSTNKILGDKRTYKNANGGTISAAGLSSGLAKGGSSGQTERVKNQRAVRDAALKGVSMVVGKRSPKMK